MLSGKAGSNRFIVSFQVESRSKTISCDSFRPYQAQQVLGGALLKPTTNYF